MTAPPPQPRPSTAGSIPGIALRLTEEHFGKQIQDRDHIPRLVNEVDPSLSLVARVSPLYDASTLQTLTEMENDASQDDPNYEKIGFHTWYQIQFEQTRGNTDSDLAMSTDSTTIHPRLVDLVRKLHEHPATRNVHFIHVAPPPAVNRAQNPDNIYQGYLNAAPQGIETQASWSTAGGDGAGVGVIDIEQGWNLVHQDLAGARVALRSGRNYAYFSHGTSVLGLLLMVDNRLGGIGISPAARGEVVSLWQMVNGAFQYNMAQALAAAVQVSNKGDFIVLEAQAYDPLTGTGLWPVGIEDATFQTMQLVSAQKGVIFVEAGSNGSNDLDAYRNLNGKQIFNRRTPDYRESHAIMVGAASSTVPHTRMYFSNYGSRIDAYGWGENVFSTATDNAGTNNTLYTHTFNGTSSATPIVAGAAINMQGRIFNATGQKWGPGLVRRTLVGSGTPSANPQADLIGVMPNLKAIFQIINAAAFETSVVEAFERAFEQKLLSKNEMVQEWAIEV